MRNGGFQNPNPQSKKHPHCADQENYKWVPWGLKQRNWDNKGRNEERGDQKKNSMTPLQDEPSIEEGSKILL